MTVPVLPTPLVRNVTRRLATSVSATPSTFTGTEQVQDWGGAWWEFDFEMAITQGREGRALSAFFAALGGKRTPFLFRDQSIYPQTGIGSPAVNGVGQTGTSLVTDGWSAAGIYAGDFFSLGSDNLTRLYQVTADVVPVAGAATIEFTPKLRRPTIDNEPLEIANPKVLLRLNGPVPAVISGADKYQFSLSAREAI